MGIDIKHSSTKEATLSVWRPLYIHENREELDILEAAETIISQVCHFYRNKAKTGLTKAISGCERII
jgi:hypothetical protein